MFQADQLLAGLAPQPPAAAPAPPAAEPAVSRRSRFGLNAANFFLAEMTGVVLPFLAKFLAERGWRDGAIGVAASLGGLGVFLTQTPAGFLVDRVRQRRVLLAGTSLLLGACYGLLPLLPAKWWCLDPLLFLAGVGQSFFLPLLGALALGLVGHAALNRTVGRNQGWNHAGNIAAGVYGVAVVAVCADLTRGKGRFNALQGVIATAQSVGGVAGPLTAGPLAQYLGFATAFRAFAAVAALAALLFICFMPETRKAEDEQECPCVIPHPSPFLLAGRDAR
jgi:predicted MFS family arabinose efflux permease